MILQARPRFRGDHECGALEATGVPRPRAVQILDAVLRLPAARRDGVAPRHLRVDLHRGDEGRLQHHYALGVAIAIVSSLSATPVPPGFLLLGDLTLEGDVPPSVVDAVNDAVDDDRIETPLTVGLAPDGAAWLRSSAAVRVAACRTLGEAIRATWPAPAANVIEPERTGHEGR